MKPHLATVASGPILSELEKVVVSTELSYATAGLTDLVFPLGKLYQSVTNRRRLWRGTLKRRHVTVIATSASCAKIILSKYFSAIRLSELHLSHPPSGHKLCSAPTHGNCTLFHDASCDRHQRMVAVPSSTTQVVIGTSDPLPHPEERTHTCTHAHTYTRRIAVIVFLCK